jgi:hypothetical protein
MDTAEIARGNFIAILRDVVGTLANPKFYSFSWNRAKYQGQIQLNKIADALDGARTLKALPPEIPKFARRDIVSLRDEILALAKLRMFKEIRMKILGELAMRGVPGDILEMVQLVSEEKTEK